MNSNRICPECGAPLPGDAPEGNCPNCLLRLALPAAAEDAPPGPLGATPVNVAKQPGDRIGRYKLLQQIGEGGCGVVYMAEQVEPVRRHVALKIIKLGMDTKNVIARFEAEQQALALMDHPSIAKVLDAGATDTGRLYFVMELVRGVKITDYCDKNHLPTRERLGLFIQVCQAIQHAHQKGVIHRDIKPSNILVTMNDGVPMPKVIDFGIAKATQQRLTDKTLFTAFEQFIGTPAYMSPEQAEMSALGIDTRSDIYSLGILLYELLTGVTPFDAKDLLQAGLNELRRIIREQEPMRPSTRLSTMLHAELMTTAQCRQAEPPKLIHLVRGDLDWIAMKALEKERSRRYETANGLAMDVQRYLADEPITARPPSGIYRFQKMVRRHQFVFAAVSAVAASLILGLGLFIWQWRKAVVARGEATREAVAEAQARERAEQALALMEIQKAEEFFAANNPSAALAYLARVLRQKPRNGTVAAQVFSNLIKQVLIVPLAEPLTHINAVYSARFSPDARRVVTASADGTAQLWNVNTGGPLTAPLRHSAAVWSAQFSPDGLRVATASEDKTARVWDASTGQPLIPPLEHSGSVGFVHFSPGGELLVTGTWEPDWKMRIWDAKSGRPLIEPIAEVHRLRCSPFSLDGGKLVTSWKTNSVMVWDPRTGAQLVRPLEHDQFVWTAEFSPDGRRILTAAHDGMARIWDAATGRLLVQPLNNGGPLWLARFSPDGQRVLTVCNDLTVQFWDASTGRALTGPVTYGQTTEYQIYYARFGEHAAYRSDRAAQFSADGQMVVVAFGGKPLVLDANTGRPLTEPLRHNLVRYAEFSRDSRMIVTGSIDGTARIWGIRNGASQQWMASARDQGKNTPSVFVPVPEWVPRLLETIAEERLNEEGAPEPAPSAQLRTLRRQLSENSGSDIWTRWGKWLTADTSAETNAFR